MNRHRLLHMLGLPVILALLLAGPAGIPWARALEPPTLDRGGLAPPQEPAESESSLSALTWNTELVEMAKEFRNMGERSLALDSAGHPHVAYGSDGLFYAWHDGAAWHVEAVDLSTDVGEYTAVAMDGADLPHIGYYDRYAGDIKYAHHDGTAWQIVVVDAGAGSC